MFVNNTILIEKPNYSMWCTRDLWQIQEGICLLLNVEPKRKLFVYDDWYDDMPSYLRKIFCEISVTAERSIDAGVLKIYQKYPNHLFCTVRPAVFIEWAKSKKIKIPEEFEEFFNQSLRVIQNESQINKIKESAQQENQFTKIVDVSNNREPKKKTNALMDLIKETHASSKDKTPMAIWNLLLILTNESENKHPVLQDMDSWNEPEACISWRSHRTAEKEMGRRRFENIISILNNPKKKIN